MILTCANRNRMLLPSWDEVNEHFRCYHAGAPSAPWNALMPKIDRQYFALPNFVFSRPVSYFLGDAVSLFHYCVKALSFSSTRVVRVVFRLDSKLRGVLAPPSFNTIREKVKAINNDPVCDCTDIASQIKTHQSALMPLASASRCTALNRRLNFSSR